MFDVSATPTAQQACEAGYTYEPVFPGTTKGIGAKITVRGPYSDAVRVHSQMVVDKVRERAALQRRGQQPDPMSVADIEREEIESALVYTIGWEGMADKGQPLPFTPDAARRLFAAQPWLRQDVLDKARDLGNFIRPCSVSSTSMPEPSSAST